MAGKRTTLRPGGLAETQETVEYTVACDDAAAHPRLGPPRVGDGVDDAVEQHRPNPVRVHVGVGLAEEGAVGEAYIGELVIPDEAAQVVEVAGGVGGRDVGKEPAADVPAAPGEVRGLAPVPLGRVLGERDRDSLPEPLLGPLAAKAAHRSAGVGATGIPADDVETPVAERVEPLRIPSNEVDAGFAGSPRVDEHRADSPIGLARQVTDHRKLDLPPGRAVPVERHSNPGTFQAAAAIAPGDFTLGPGGRGRREKSETGCQDRRSSRLLLSTPSHRSPPSSPFEPPCPGTIVAQVRRRLQIAWRTLRGARMDAERTDLLAAPFAIATTALAFLVALIAAAGAQGATRSVVDQRDDLATPQQVHVIYALPSDGIDHELDTNGTLAASVGSWQTWLRGQTGGTGPDAGYRGRSAGHRLRPAAEHRRAARLRGALHPRPDRGRAPGDGPADTTASSTPSITTARRMGSAAVLPGRRASPRLRAPANRSVPSICRACHPHPRRPAPRARSPAPANRLGTRSSRRSTS